MDEAHAEQQALLLFCLMLQLHHRKSPWSCDCTGPSRIRRRSYVILIWLNANRSIHLSFKLACYYFSLAETVDHFIGGRIIRVFHMLLSGKCHQVRYNSKVGANRSPAVRYNLLFILTGNTSAVTTTRAQKAKFDLKASLSRPLTYKPHTGKLEHLSGNKWLVRSQQKNYKWSQAKTREDRRAEQVKDRKQKEGVLGVRRGLVMMWHFGDICAASELIFCYLLTFQGNQSHLFVVVGALKLFDSRLKIASD